MYVQRTSIHVPLGNMERLRAIIAHEYLPKIRIRSGCVSAMLLEQVDDPDRAELLILWESQESVERFNDTGQLEATIHGLAAYLPGVQVQRQGYAMTIFTGMRADELQAARPASVS